LSEVANWSSAGDDGELIDAARSGDQAAWDALVDRYSGVVWAPARRDAANQAGAREVWRLTWLRFADSLHCIEPDLVMRWLDGTAARESSRLARLGHGRVHPVT
jgi:hypothetical protein